MKTKTKKFEYVSAYPAEGDRKAWLACSLPYRTAPYGGKPGPHEVELYKATGQKSLALPQGGQGANGGAYTVGQREAVAAQALSVWEKTGSLALVKECIRQAKRGSLSLVERAAQGAQQVESEIEVDW